MCIAACTVRRKGLGSPKRRLDWSGKSVCGNWGLGPTGRRGNVRMRPLQPFPRAELQTHRLDGSSRGSLEKNWRQLLCAHEVNPHEVLPNPECWFILGKVLVPMASPFMCLPSWFSARWPSHNSQPPVIRNTLTCPHPGAPPTGCFHMHPLPCCLSPRASPVCEAYQYIKRLTNPPHGKRSYNQNARVCFIKRLQY